MRISLKSELLIELLAVSVILAAGGVIQTNNDLICDDDLRISQLNVTGSNGTGEIITEEFRTGTLNVNSIEATTVIISSLDISAINPSSEDGTIQLVGLLNTESLSLLQTKQTESKSQGTHQKSFLKNETTKVRQWSLVVEENLEMFGEKYANSRDHINGWTLGSEFRKQVLDYELKKPVMKNENQKRNQETVILSKQYKGLSGHKQVLLDGVFHFDTLLLAGKAIFIKIDGRIAWLQHNRPQNTTDCQEELQHCDAGWATPVNVIIPHTQESLKVEIGVIHKPLDKNECLIKRFSDYFRYCSNHFSLSMR